MAYRSGFERSLVAQMNRAKVPFKYETMKIDYTTSHVYTPDFVLDNGIIIEAKGYMRPTDIAKMRAIKSQHPDLDIRFVFMEGDKKLRGKTTYGQWAERHGFPWASDSIPSEWFSE